MNVADEQKNRHETHNENGDSASTLIVNKVKF